MRKYHAVSGKEIDMPVTGLSSTKTIKVAVLRNQMLGNSIADVVHDIAEQNVQ